MTVTHEILARPSSKSGLHSKEHYIITRGKTVFLRVLGGETEGYELMTATADEDDGSYLVCSDTGNLVLSGLDAAREFYKNPVVLQDNYGRAYVKITDSRSLDDLESAVYLFFAAFDKFGKPETEAEKELREIYEEFSPYEYGEEDLHLNADLRLSPEGRIVGGGA